jgi:hypothetical protein
MIFFPEHEIEYRPFSDRAYHDGPQLHKYWEDEGADESKGPPASTG